MNGNELINRSGNDVSAAWKRIERWISNHIPAWANIAEADKLFQPPSGAQEIVQLEAHVGLELPDQLKALLMTSNGCRPGDYPLPMKATRPTNWRTMSVSETAAQWDLLTSIADQHPYPDAVRVVGPVQAVWWSKSWIPIAESGTGDVVCTDLGPTSGGKPGQLILYEHDFAERKVLYQSLLEWLRECTADLERDEYHYVNGVGLQSKDSDKA